MGEKLVKTWLKAIPTGNFFHQAAGAGSCQELIKSGWPLPSEKVFLEK
jgi:hypothetical protein